MLLVVNRMLITFVEKLVDKDYTTSYSKHPDKTLHCFNSNINKKPVVEIQYQSTSFLLSQLE